MGLALYIDGYFVSQWDASCIVALEEKQLPYTTVRALLRDGGGVPAGLAGHTGIPRVPALQHDDFWLTESLAIIEYLEETFPPPAHAPLLPADLRGRAKARQLMAYVRTGVNALRDERSWWMCVYPEQPPPLSVAGEHDVRELLELAHRTIRNANAHDWTIAYADLALTLLRLARTGYPLPQVIEEFVAAMIARPSVRAYIEHPRPPNPPVRALAAG